MKHIAAVAALTALLVADGGCASSRVVVPGLPSVAANPIGGSTYVYDVIANGHDSCPRARVVGRDPLSHRYPPCPGEESPAVPMALVVAPAGVARHWDGMWNVHGVVVEQCPDRAQHSTSEFSFATCPVGVVAPAVGASGGPF